jgi:uridine phosphorylase
LKAALTRGWDETKMPLKTGASWTTDAPFRETEEAISWCREKGVLTVEMEAAALYALASAKNMKIICFAHVTNQLGQNEGDFEKGLHQGSLTGLQLISQAAKLILAQL